MNELILSDSEKNDSLVNVLTELKSFFTLNKNAKYKSNSADVCAPRLSCLSHFLPAIHIFAYDHPEFLAKFPEGIITESFILIPSEKVLNIRDAFSSVEPRRIGHHSQNPDMLHNDANQYAFFFAKPVMECLELNLNIQLSDAEKNQIVSDLTKFSPDPQTCALDDSWKFSLNAVKMKNSELLAQIENKNMGIISVLENFPDFSNRDKYLTTWLKQNDFSNFPTIQAVLDKSPTMEVDTSVSLQDFSTFSRSDLHHTLVDLLVLNKKYAENKENLDLQKEDDFNSFIAKSKDNLFPFLTATSDSIFQVAFSKMCREIFLPNSKNKNYLPRREVLAKEVYETSSDYIRTHLIKIVTEFDLQDNLYLNDDQEVLQNKLKQNKSKLKM